MTLAATSTNSPSYLIDASIYIFRAYFALPEDWHSPEGYPVNAVYGYTRFLIEFMTGNSVEYVAAAFDNSLGTGFRHEIYPLYKSRRELPDEALEFQLNACRRVTELLAIPCFSSTRYEADDIIATLAAAARRDGRSTCILTRDKDLGQLLYEGDIWWDYAARTRYGAAEFFGRFGVRPDQFADYLALVGDAVDDIPGVPGVGPKTAVKLLEHFDSLDEVIRRCDEITDLPLRGAQRVATKLREHQSEVAVYRRLTGLFEEVPISHDGASHLFAETDYDAIQHYLAEIGLEQLSTYCRRLRDLIDRE